MRTVEERQKFREELCASNMENEDAQRIVVALMELCRTIDENTHRLMQGITVYVAET